MPYLYQPEESLAFDDIMLVPRFSTVKSRSVINTRMSLGPAHLLTLKTPIIASPMDTVCEWEMAEAMGAAGGLGIVHRYMTIEALVTQLQKIDSNVRFGAAVGATGDYLDRAYAIAECGGSVILVDVAHGDHQHTVDAVKVIRDRLPGIHVMAGNVATREGYQRLADAGANSVRVGVGSGSVCTTRIQTGHGIPLLESLKSIPTSGRTATVVADGGIRNSGDAVKAFAFGADAIMLGSYLSGTTETPGDTDVFGFKIYRGMASKDAQMEWRGSVGGEEGVSTRVLHKGSVRGVIDDMMAGIRSGCSYSGCDNLSDLHRKAYYTKITNAGMQESHPHGA
jgi:IMP dehydrogenase